jgi:hypothetical protein
MSDPEADHCAEAPEELERIGPFALALPARGGAA